MGTSYVMRVDLHDLMIDLTLATDTRYYLQRMTPG